MAPEAAERQNVSLAGYHDLDGRPGLKMAMQEVEGRWYLYLGHIWHQGWSIVDVTDPTAPTLERYLEGPENSWTHQIQVADGKMITGLDWPRSGWQPVDGPSRDPEADVEEGMVIWDVSDPTDPERLSHYRTGRRGTHRNYYDGGDYVYAAASPDGFEGYQLSIVDISDPKDPRRVSQWWWDGQAPGEESPPEAGYFGVPGTYDEGEKPVAPVPYYFHGPAYVVDDLAYLSYGRLGLVVLDISEKTSPELVGQVDFGGLGSRLGTHSAIPFPESELVVVNSEALQERDGDSLNYTFLVDVSDPQRMNVHSSLPLPSPEAGLPYRDYYEKGGRFGPHNQHQYQHQQCLWKPSDLLFMTYFNAGLRIFDVSNPLQPSEAGYFVPEDPTERIGTVPETLVTQLEDVIVDVRGYIYCTGKNSGLWILEHDLTYEGYT